MFRRTINRELSRRVAAYFVLFFVLAVAWLAVSAVLITQSTLKDRTEERCLAQIDRASKNVILDVLRNPRANLQPLVEHFQSENSLENCAIVSSDGLYLAHSSRELVGQVHTEPKGEYYQRGDVQIVHFSDSNSRAISKYSVPLHRGGEEFGTLHVAVPAPSVWAELASVTPYLPLAAAVPLLCLVFGAIVLRRMVRPWVEIETELNRVTVALSPTEVELQEVKASGPAARGWNRLVDQCKRDRSCSGLGQRLNQSVGQLRQRQANEILDSLPDGLAVTDEEGRIVFANQALAAIADSDVEGLLRGGQTMQACLDLRGQEESNRPLLVPETQARTVVAEIKRLNKGTDQVLRVARHPLRAADGRSSAGHVWSARDISQQKLAEQARNAFLDAATHELRTPLSNIKAYAETLTLSEKLDVEKQKNFCNTINSEATRLGRLIDDLLSISSMEVGSLSLAKEEVDVERLLREAVQKVSPQMEQKGIAFKATFPEKWPALHLDKDKMAAALVNLLGNAVKYTPNGGRVTLTVTIIEDGLQIEVADTGLGISASELPKIFDKFFRSSNPRVQKETGSGLGLSFVQEVVRMHNGTLNAKSEQDVGSTFTVILPRD